jgi:predicted nucleic acid-binding protein
MTSSTARRVCVDASLVVPLMTRTNDGLTLSEAVAGVVRGWAAPGGAHAALLRGGQRAASLRRAWGASTGGSGRCTDLGITWFGDADLHRRPLDIAGEHALPVDHNAHCLALAERLDAELWTSVRPLCQAAGSALPWLRLVQ